MRARGRCRGRLNFRPERLEDELPDLVFTADTASMPPPPRLTIQSEGTRMSSAYGHTGKGKLLDDILDRGSRRW